MSLDTFGAMWQNVAARAGASRDSDVARIKGYAWQGLVNVWRRFQWPERERNVELTTVSLVAGMTCAWANDSDVVSWVSGPTPDAAWAGRWIAPGWTAPYKVLSVSGNDITVHRPFLDDSLTIVSPVYVTELELPVGVAEILEQDIQLLYKTGATLGFASAPNARRSSPFPRAGGVPLLWSPGRRVVDATGVFSLRSLNVGPNAPDRRYVLSVNYLCHYPPLPDVDPDSEPIHVPDERRELVVWNALSRAYTEHPFVDTQQAERFEALYEKNLSIALNAHKEEAGAVEYVRGYDEGDRYVGTGLTDGAS